MKDNEKLSSANLYDILDKREDEKIKKDIRNQKIKSVKNKVLFGSYEAFKIITLVAIIVGAFFLRYQYSNEINQVFDKFTNTITGVVDKSSSNATMKKSLEEAKKEASVPSPAIANVPNITITGSVDKENGKYIIFKYENKIFTLKEGDKFNNNFFTVNKIEGNMLEIEDADGNIFSYSK